MKNSSIAMAPASPAWNRSEFPAKALGAELFAANTDQTMVYTAEKSSTPSFVRTRVCAARRLRIFARREDFRLL
jgi:hypothetical protein